MKTLFGESNELHKTIHNTNCQDRGGYVLLRQKKTRKPQRAQIHSHFALSKEGLWPPYLAGSWCKLTRPKPPDRPGSPFLELYTVIRSKDLGSGRPALKAQFFGFAG